MKNLINEAKNETIVSFHIGRGGRYNNAGHITFIGEKKITDFTNDLFIRFENESKVLEKFMNKQILNAIVDAIQNEDFETLKSFSILESDLGKKEYYCGASLSSTGLYVDNNGTGSIDIDGEYNTTTSLYLSDCSEGDIKLILENSNCEYISNEVDEFIKENWSELIEE